MGSPSKCTNNLTSAPVLLAFCSELEGNVITLNDLDLEKTKNTCLWRMPGGLGWAPNVSSATVLQGPSRAEPRSGLGEGARELACAEPL